MFIQLRSNCREFGPMMIKRSLKAAHVSLWSAFLLLAEKGAQTAWRPDPRTDSTGADQDDLLEGNLFAATDGTAMRYHRRGRTDSSR
jgi:hypothetical protein